MADKDTCALWYWRQYAVTYALFDSEHDAASTAAFMENDAQGVPIGIQFSDGRLVRAAEWEALEEARRRSTEAYATADHSPTRKVRDPFEDQVVVVEANEPAWLGKP